MLLGTVFIVTGLLLLIGGWREVFRARGEGRDAVRIYRFEQGKSFVH